MNRYVRRCTPLGAALLAGLVLTACGGGTSTSTDTGAAPTSAATASPTPTPTSSPSAADVTFAQQMIPHHRQAIQMAGLAAEQASSPEVKALAKRIEAAQEPEIKTMESWLESWDEDMPPSAMPPMDGMGMSQQDMAKLMAARGQDFDRMFLTMMIQHHQSAVAMAQTAQQQATVSAVKEMAAEIVTAQQAEIEEMQRALSAL